MRDGVVVGTANPRLLLRNPEEARRRSSSTIYNRACYNGVCYMETALSLSLTPIHTLSLSILLALFYAMFEKRTSFSSSRFEDGYYDDVPCRRRCARAHCRPRGCFETAVVVRQSAFDRLLHRKVSGCHGACPWFVRIVQNRAVAPAGGGGGVVLSILMLL